jgi:peptidoglycan/LPS O-acetylase OafA/YrhL
MWVVIGHVFSFFLGSGVVNIDDIEVPANKPSFLLIEAGLVSVDIFFMLGGFFLAFVFLRQKS